MKFLDTAWSHNNAEAVNPENDGLCNCGCGQPAVEGTELHAILLAESKRSLRQLKAKAKSGGARTRRAERLLWAWNRCERGFESYVHGQPLQECGPPTPLWVNSWRRRVREL